MTLMDEINALQAKLDEVNRLGEFWASFYDRSIDGGNKKQEALDMLDIIAQNRLQIEQKLNALIDQLEN